MRKNSVMSGEIRARDLGLVVTGSSGYEEHVICPFHDDRNASASWNYRKGMFYCHTCKIGFNLRQISERLDFDVSEIDIRSIAETEHFKLELFTDLPKLAPRTPLTAKMSKYLRGRNLKSYMSNLYFSGTLDKLGVSIYPPNRLSVPCCSITRVMEPKPGHPRYYVRGEKPALWPMDELKDEYNVIFVVEGIFSRLLISQCLDELPIDHQSAAFSMLGSTIKEEELKQIFDQIKYKRALFLFDDDFAGNIAANTMKVLVPTAESYVVSKKLDMLSPEGLQRFVRRFV